MRRRSGSSQATWLRFSIVHTNLEKFGKLECQARRSLPTTPFLDSFRVADNKLQTLAAMRGIFRTPRQHEGSETD